MSGVVRACCVHFDSFSAVSASIIETSDVKTSKIKTCAESWIESQKEPERSVAERFVEGFLDGGNFRHHLQCYQRFTNMVRIAAAQKRKVSLLYLFHLLIC